MNKVIEKEVEGIIDKYYIKNKIKRDLLTSRPGLATQVSNKILEKCMLYISGYIKCLKYHGIQPINSTEMKELLTQECIDWVLDYVDNGGR